MVESINKEQTFKNKTFTFLNQTHHFGRSIDWNFNGNGKLWTYNLNYFEFLHQERISRDKGIELIKDFINKIGDIREGLEPYPISLRGINWVKFLSKYEINDKKINASLYAQYRILQDNLEYHLLGNHLLENGCSLLFGSYYFQDKGLYDKAERILIEQAEEQIMDDGGHFERSTMYHCILLERMMDCYNLVANNDVFENNGLEDKLKTKTQLMLGWLGKMTIDGRTERVDGENHDRGQVINDRHLPLFNDGAKGIAPSSEELFEYASRLGLQETEVGLSSSGYRRYATDTFDLICDVGKIGPDYQPGHAHSDTLSFVLYYQGQPILVDPGISTYENNERRQLERSTAFHNTVQYQDKEQSEIWNAFRVGRRAKVNIHKENKTKLVASHDGYKPWGITHKREWVIHEDQINIKDSLTGKENALGTFYLHFHPSFFENLLVEGNSIQVDGIKIEFEAYNNIKKLSYDCPKGYNQYIEAPRIEVIFINNLITKIFWDTEVTEN